VNPHRLARLVLWLAAAGWTAAPAQSTQEVYDRFKDRLLQVRIIDTDSNARSVIGSGFYVDGAGHLITNYHVVSRVILRPEQYRAEVVGAEGGDPAPARVLAVDVVNDLAVLATGRRDTPHLAVRTKPVRKGTRMYSLGNPHDLGMTIVEGTYNGYVDDSLHRRIHLTGSLNPGMSGGPTINARGEVVGVNVATAGNQIGFLVPAEFVRRLTAALPETPPGPGALLEQVGRQLLANQETMTQRLLARPLATKSLGPYRVAAAMVEGLNCWGDSATEQELYYSETSYVCGSKHQIYVGSGLRTGTVRYQHTFLKGRDIGSLHFYALFEQYFSRPDAPRGGRKDDVGRYDCRTGFVTANGMRLKAALCLRAYKRFAGLFDAVLNVATLNRPDAGLHSVLALRGFSRDNIRRLAARYLEVLAWKE